MAKTRVALEITEDSVRAVEMTDGRSPTLLAAGEVMLPPGAAKDSEIVDRDVVVGALRRLWTDAGIKGRNVVLGVGGRRVLVREHSSTLRETALVRQALPFDVQDRLPVPVDQAVLDFIPTHVDDEGMHGLMVAAVSEQMEDLVSVLAEAGLTADSIDLLAFGYCRALAGLAPKGVTGMLIGIGEHTTQVVIATDGVPQFARAIPIDVPRGEARVAEVEAAPTELETLTGFRTGGVEESADGAIRSRGDLRRARTAVATPPAGVPEAPAADAMSADLQDVLIDLVTRLRGTVSFYRDRTDAAPVAATFITGLHTDHPRLQAALAQVAGTEVRRITGAALVRVKNGLHPAVDERIAPTVALLLGGTK